VRKFSVFVWPVLAVLMPCPAAADSFWDHNGSEMRLHAEGAKRVLSYEKPRSGIVAQGVERGTILFEGAITDEKYGEYKGTAFIFSKRCGNKPYAVEGGLSDRGYLVTLDGMAPDFDRTNCKSGGTKKDELLFKFLRSDAAAPKFPSAADGTICGYADHDVANYEPADYLACLEAQANKICQGRNELEELHRCFNGAVGWAHKKSGLTGNANVLADTPGTKCDAGKCHLSGGGSQYSCIRVNVSRVQECDVDGEDERCNEVECPIRTCRMMCSKAEEDDER
jgi:hypothetical protein